MSEHIRGDIIVTIDGEDYALSPTFKAIAAIEHATGKSLLQLPETVMLRNVGQTAVILHQAMLANGHKKLSLDAIGESIVSEMQEEDPPILKAIVEFLLSYVSKSKELGSEKKLEASKATS